jgi:uncharacterized damage-inducible protein DinB
MDLAAVKYQYAITQRVLQRNLEGVSHEQSLQRPASGANCLNWVLGHVAHARVGTVGVLGGRTPAGAGELDVYQAAVADEFAPARALPLERLRDLLSLTHEALLTAIEAARPEQLAAPAPFSPTGNPDETVASLVAALAFHEAYHCGQTGLLRREVGLKGTIKGPGQRRD